MIAIMLRIILFIALIIVYSFAQISLPACPWLQPVEDFSIANYSGLWYELKRYPNMYEIDYHCARVNNTASGPNGIMIDYAAFNGRTGANIRWDFNATRVQNPENPQEAIFKASFSGFVEPRLSVLAVLDVDYNNYVVLAMCEPMEDESLLYAWVMSRRKKIEAKHWEQIRRVLLYNYLPTSIFTMVNQEHCPPMYN